MSTLAAIGAALAVLGALIGWAACCMSGQCAEVERCEADRERDRAVLEALCSMGTLCDWPNCASDCPWLRGLCPKPREGSYGEPPLRRTAGKLLACPSLFAPPVSRLAASVLLLGLSGCSVMERASVQPMCLAFCQIMQTEREGVLNVRRR